MKLRRRPRGRVLAVLAAVLILAVAVTVGLAIANRPVPLTVRNLRIAVTDGPAGNQHVSLDATFYTPPGSGRVPAVLVAHGFGGTKNSVRGEAEELARAGYAVLTWSARGFGTSTGQVALDSPDYEVKDTEQLISWLAKQPRVQLDGPGDPRVGIAGASYGGGIALLTAAYDRRVDAIVPQITWNNLATALFPNAAEGATPGDGVFKRQWAGLLFTEGSVGFGRTVAPPTAAGQSSTGQSSTGSASAGQSGTGAGAATGAPGQAAAAQAAQCGRFLPSVCAVYRQVATAGQPTPAAISLLTRNSPASVAGRLNVPTLLIQGQHDSLFGLDQADANYRAIQRTGAPVDMVWFNGGHDGGNQEDARLNLLTQQWFDRWLKSPASPFPRSAAAQDRPATTAGTGQPAFAVTRNRGFDPSSNQDVLGVATAPSYPGLGGSTQATVTLQGPPQTIARPPGGAPAAISVFPGFGALGGLTFDVPGQSAAFQSAPLTRPVQVTGAPVIQLRVTGQSAITLFAKLYDVDQAGNAILPDQLAAPLTVPAGEGRNITVQLPAIDHSFAAGHQLRLVLSATDYAYATPQAGAVYQVALASPGLSVPSDPALGLSSSGLPWWTWAAPIAALAAAALIMATRRRRRSDDLDPDLADVPLEITGLTKRYKDGQLAVSDLSLRVERGQILGLLGPNGAGKTTTLRMLMGLIHPDAGTITIFGRRVRRARPFPARLVRRGPRLPAAPVRPGQPGPLLARHRPSRRRLSSRKRTRHRRSWRGHRPPGAHLLARHEPAAGHRPGHARLAGPAGPRRADERPGPAADQGDARRPDPVRRRRPDRDPLQPHARRGRADLHARGGDGAGPAAGRGPGGRDHRVRRGPGRRHAGGPAGRGPAGRPGRHRQRRAAPGRRARPPERRGPVHGRGRAGRGGHPG